MLSEKCTRQTSKHVPKRCFFFFFFFFGLFLSVTLRLNRSDSGLLDLRRKCTAELKPYDPSCRVLPVREVL